MPACPDVPVCPFCGFRNLAVAVFCGGCGRPLHGVACHNCGFDNLGNSLSCERCAATLDNSSSEDSETVNQGSGVASRSALARTPETTAQEPPSNLADRIPGSHMGEAVIASTQMVLAEKSTPLLVSGAIAAVLGQVGLYFSVEPNAEAPLGYLLVMALGVALFALGSTGRWLRRSPVQLTFEESTSPTRSQEAAARFRSTLGVGGLLAGIAALALLLAMLAAGSVSGGTLLIWIVALVAFASPFIPRLDTAISRIKPWLMEWFHSYWWDTLAVVLLVAAFIAINAHDLRDWYYSAIGDEYLFYEHARRIVDEGISGPFSQEGVYNKHPVMSSIFQAAVMRLFGADYFGWTFSEVLNAALTIPAVYLLGRAFGGRTAALAAAAIFAFSHYIFAFSHTGYANLSSLPVSSWSLLLFVWGWRNGNPLLLYAAGVIAGLGFYTHYSGRAIMPIILMFVLASVGSKRLLNLRHLNLWPLGVGFILAVAPTFVVEQEQVLTRMFGEVVGGYSEVVSGSVGQRLIDNLELNLPAFSYNASVHTYVYGPLFDPVSGVLAALGIGFALGHIRLPAYRLLLIWFAAGIFMTGVLSPYPHVVITRLLFVVPPLALMAGLLVSEFSELVHGKWAKWTRLPKVVPAAAMFLPLLPAILILNLWQFWHVTPSVFPHSQEAVALKAFMSDQCDGDADKTVFVGRATGEGSLMQQVLTSFHPDDPPLRQIDHHHLAEGTELPGPPPDCVVFINPDTQEARRLQDDLAHRYPEGRVVSFANPSNTTFVDVFTR